MSYISGIFSGAFVHKVGPRNGGLLGSMLILIGFVSSFLATSVLYLNVSIGFGVGMFKFTIMSRQNKNTIAL